MVGVIASLVERLRNWPKPRTHEEKVEQAIDRLMLVEAWLFWYIQELEDLKTQLSMDPILRLLVPIVDVMITQLWQLMKRWTKVKVEVIREARKGLMRMERKIKGDGFAIEAKYHKGVIDLMIYLNGGKGDNILIPNLGIDANVLKAIRLGWRASDSSNNKDRYLEMSTTFGWQVLSWLIAHLNVDVWIYAGGVSVSMDGIKPRWNLQINSFDVEWLSDKEAYEEMARLPRNLLAIAILHAILGDGSSKSGYGLRSIKLNNDDHSILELVKTKLEEFNVKGSIYPDKGGWIYEVTGPEAKKLAEAAVKVLEELAPAIKQLYDQMASGRYEMIYFEKWAKMIRVSKYIINGSKIEFAGTWTPRFTKGSIILKIETKDVKLAEELKGKAKSEGVNAVVKKYIRRDNYEAYYNVVIEWSELKKYLCNNEELRAQLIKAAMKAIENCRLMNMLNKGRRKDCSRIAAAMWLQRLTDPQWLRENLKCFDNNPAQRSP